MPVEIIGEFGTPGTDPEWLEAKGKQAIRCITTLCGEPPPEMELEIQWHEHGLGDYPLIVLAWEDANPGDPWDYIARCEVALTAYENGGELTCNWPMRTIAPEDDDEFEEEYRNSKTPQTPSALNAKEPISTTFANPEIVQRFLARAKRLLAPSPEELKEMPTTSKRIH
jgi:hypothetical protein